MSKVKKLPSNKVYKKDDWWTLEVAERNLICESTPTFLTIRGKRYNRIYTRSGVAFENKSVKGLEMIYGRDRLHVYLYHPDIIQYAIENWSCIESPEWKVDFFYKGKNGKYYFSDNYDGAALKELQFSIPEKQAGFFVELLINYKNEDVDRSS